MLKVIIFAVVAAVAQCFSYGQPCSWSLQPCQMMAPPPVQTMYQPELINVPRMGYYPTYYNVPSYVDQPALIQQQYISVQPATIRRPTMTQVRGVVPVVQNQPMVVQRPVYVQPPPPQPMLLQKIQPPCGGGCNTAPSPCAGGCNTGGVVQNSPANFWWGRKRH